MKKNLRLFLIMFLSVCELAKSLAATNNDINKNRSILRSVSVKNLLAGDIKKHTFSGIKHIFTVPTVQASGLTFTNNKGTGITVNWVNGNGSKRAVFASFGATSGSPALIDGTTYTPGSYGTTPSEVGNSNWFCLYSGTGTSADVTGLYGGQPFRFMVVEFNGAPGNEQYLTTTGTNNPVTVSTFSTNANLSSLIVNTATLTPSFNQSIFSYHTNVAATTNSITVTPIAVNADAVIKVNGVVVPSGSASAPINLTSDINTISVATTAQDGISTTSYTLAVAKAVAAPAISYANNTVIYKQGVAITPLTPANSAGSVPNIAYGTTTTITGGGKGYADGNSSIARFNLNPSAPAGMASDQLGNIYITDNNTIRKISSSGIVTTFAGNTVAGYADSTGTAASFNNPKGITIDGSGNLYVADVGNNRIRKVTPDGVVTTFAGSGASGHDNGTGIAASFSSPSGIAVDNAGSLYVTDRGNNLIRKITSGGDVSTFAGSGTSGHTDGVGVGATFSGPQSITIDKQGNLYVGDFNCSMIRKLTPAAVVTTFNPIPASSISAYGLTSDAIGNIYFTGPDINKIYKVDISGAAAILAGGAIKSEKDGIGGAASFTQPVAIASDNLGNLYVADAGTDLIRKVITTGYTISPILNGLDFDGATGIISGTPTIPFPATNFTVTGINTAGSGNTQVNISVLSNFANLSDLSVSSGLLNPGFDPATTSYTVKVGNKTSGIQVKPSVILTSNATIKVNGTVTASGASSANIPLNYGDNAITVSVTAQDGITIKNYTILVKRSGSAPAITYSPASVKLAVGAAITPITPVNSGGAVPAIAYGQASTVAGGASQQHVDGNGTNARFENPGYITIDQQGNLYMSDNYRIRKIAPDGTVSTLAGNDNGGDTNGTGTAASFLNDTKLVADGLGNLFAISGNNIRKITSAGVVTTFAGIGTNASGTGITIDTQNNIYVSDPTNQRIEKITPAGNITTYASVDYPGALTIDAYGTIYVASLYQIKKVSPTGNVTPLAGNATPGNVDGTGAAAYFNTIQGLSIDFNGNLFVTNGNRVDNRIRKVSPEGIVTTLSGDITRGYADGNGTTARFDTPYGLVTDAGNILYVADRQNFRVRKVNTSGYTISPALPNGLTFDSATGTIQGTPTVAIAPATYTVNAYNNSGSDQTTITIETRILPDSAYLSALTISAGTLTPVFNPASTNYTLNVPNSTASITLTPATANTGATINVNNSAVVSGSASTAISLNVGTNTITVATVSKTGIIKNYTIVITRDKSPQTITFTPFTAKAYGTANFAPAITSNSTLPITYRSDNPLVATIESGLVHIVGVGIVNITASQVGNSNYYDATPVTQVLTVTPATLIITADNKSKSYSDVNPPLTLSYSGFVNGDTQTALLTPASLSTTASALSAVGTYPITASGATAANYTVNFIAGTLTVNAPPAPTISALSTATGLSGTTVTLTGTYFLNATSVSFGGTPAASFTINSATSITAVVGNGTSGNVAVTTATGTGTIAGFTYVFDLPSTNFNLTITGATCRGSNNGSVNITASKSLNYTATITGNGLNASHPFTNNLTINNLAAGTYNICITVSGQSAYQQCYTAVIIQPDDITLYTTVIKKTNEVVLSLQGASVYYVNLNGQSFTTYDSQLTLPLAKGANKITVSTDKPCQGTLTRSVLLNNDMIVYPNPFGGLLNVNLGNVVVQKAILSIYDINNRIVYTTSYANQTGVVQTNLEKLSMGFYILKLSADNTDTFFKIIKK